MNAQVFHLQKPYMFTHTHVFTCLTHIVSAPTNLYTHIPTFIPIYVHTIELVHLHTHAHTNSHRYLDI